MLMDSPLDKAGLLQVYIHTEKNTLIEINPQTHIPRTFPGFCGLMGEDVFPRTPVPEGPAAVMIGAFAHGAVNVDYTEKTVSISNYPLSAALTCAKMCSAFEEVWGVLSQQLMDY